MRSVLMALLLLAPVAASAVPSTISHQGRLLDSTGVALTGSHQVTFRLYDGASGGSAVWSEDHSLEFDNGFFSTSLGATSALDSEVLDGDDYWLSIAIDGGAELPERLPLNSVPYAVTAGSVTGGVVDASEIRVNGATIVDSSGDFTAEVAFDSITNLPAGIADGDDDTLGGLSCGSGELVSHDGNTFTCVAQSTLSIAGGQISSPVPVSQLPVGTGSDTVAAGDASYSKAEVDTMIGDISVGAGLGLEESGGVISMSEYSYGPLISNARFESGDATGWSVTSGAGAVKSVSDGQAGGFVFANEPFKVAWVSSDARVPVRPGQDYVVSGSFRRTETVGNAGTYYLAVRLFDSDGNNISGDGAWWYYPVSGAVLGDQEWHGTSIAFGPNYGREFPAEAATMTVGAILNYDNGNRNYEVTNLQLRVSDPPSRPVIGAWYPTAHQTGCSAGTYCLVKLNGTQLDTRPGAFDVSDDDYTITVNMSGYYMLDAHALVYQNGNVVTHFEVYRNGARIQLSHHEYNTSGGWMRHDIHRPEYFAAGDKITVKSYHSGSPHPSHQAHSGPDYTRLSLARISE